MKNYLLIGICLGIVFTISFSLLFISVLGYAGIGIGICLGVSLGMTFTIAFKHIKPKDDQDNIKK